MVILEMKNTYLLRKDPPLIITLNSLFFINLRSTKVHVGIRNYLKSTAVTQHYVEVFFQKTKVNARAKLI